jgi:hypothetical protein
MNNHQPDLHSGETSAECGDFFAPIDPPFHHSTIPEDLKKSSLILYDDGDWSKGHYEGIFSLYAKALLKNGCRVSAVCPKPDLIRKQLGPLADQCTFHQTFLRV